MRRLILGAALAVALATPALAVDEVIESVGNYKSFRILAGADTTLKLANFDFDGNTELDMVGISQIAYFGSSGPDTLWYHANQGWWPNPLCPSSDASIPLRTKRFSDILRSPSSGVPSPADSTVLRYHNMGASDVYLYVWGQ